MIVPVSVAMEKARICNKCFLSIDAKVDLYTVCEGECACFFHAECVAIDESDLCTMARRTNMIWMCDACLFKFRSLSERTPADSPIHPKPIDDEVRDLKIVVAGILDTLSKIAPTAITNDCGLLHSTPVSTNLPPDEISTSANVSYVGNDQPSPSHCVESNDLSLFISNIDSSVTESDVRTMVLRALGTHVPERIDVLKLESKIKNRQPPDFISFKVSLNKKWKSKALNSATWPKYIKCREFVPRQNLTWRPEQ